MIIWGTAFRWTNSLVLAHFLKLHRLSSQGEGQADDDHGGENLSGESTPPYGTGSEENAVAASLELDDGCLVAPAYLDERIILSDAVLPRMEPSLVRCW